MTAGAGADKNQAIDAHLGRLARMTDGGDIVKHLATIGMRGIDHGLRQLQAGNDRRHLVLDADLHVRMQAVVGGMANLVHRIGCNRQMRVLGSILTELVLDARQPLAKHGDRPRIERRERADNAGLALGDDKFRPGHEKQRRAHHRHGEAILEDRGQRHCGFHPGFELKG